MTKVIEVKDLITKQMDELIKDLTVDDITSDDVEQVKNLLKGYFEHHKSSIKSGYQFQVGKYALIIAKNNISSKRVEFKFQQHEKRFSIPTNILLNDFEPFPYAVDDKVIYDNTVCNVVAIRRSTNAIIIDYNGNRKQVPVKKVEKFFE